MLGGLVSRKQSAVNRCRDLRRIIAAADRHGHIVLSNGAVVIGRCHGEREGNRFTGRQKIEISRRDGVSPTHKARGGCVRRRDAEARFQGRLQTAGQGAATPAGSCRKATTYIDHITGIDVVEAEAAAGSERLTDRRNGLAEGEISDRGGDLRAIVAARDGDGERLISRGTSIVGDPGHEDFSGHLCCSQSLG